MSEKLGNEPAYPHEYKADHYGNMAMYSGITTRQQFVKDFACAFLSNPGYIEVISKLSRHNRTTDDKSVAALACIYADVCLRSEKETRE